MRPSLINAIQVHAYGNADQLKLERIPMPEPQTGEVLVRVHAAGATLVIGKSVGGGPKAFCYQPSPMCPVQISPVWSQKSVLG